VPTPETADAVTRLIEARTRLTEITKKLNKTHSGKDFSNETRHQYELLQKEWDIALERFKAAVNEFTEAIQRAKPSS
jgi:hypothetical protein